jgi:streptogramin lyase
VTAQTSHENYTLPVQLSWNRPEDIVTDSDLNVYVIDIESHVFKYSPNGTELGSWKLPSTMFSFEMMFTIDSHQNIYYTNRSGDNISRYNLQTGDLATYPETIWSASGINFQVDANGNMYVFTKDGLAMFNSSGAFANITTPYSSLRFPTPVRFGYYLRYADRSLNICCYMDGSLYKFSSDGTLLFNVSLGIQYDHFVYDMAVDNNGTIFAITDKGLVSLNSTGAVLANVSFANGNFRGKHIIVDDANNVYLLSDITSHIYKFTSTLQLVDQWMPKYFPTYGIKSLVVGSTFNIYALWHEHDLTMLLKLNPNGEIIANLAHDLFWGANLEFDPRTENLLLKNADNFTLVFYDRNLQFADSIGLPIEDEYTYGPNGLLYSMNYTHINVYNTTNNYSMTSITIPFPAYYQNFAIDRENSIYIFRPAYIIAKLNSDGRVIGEFNLTELFHMDNPHCFYLDVKTDSQNNVYISDQCNLCAMTSSGVPITCFTSPSSGFKRAEAFWIDSLDRLYALGDQYSSTPLEPLYVFNSTLNVSLSSSSSSSSSTAMASSSLAMSSSQSLLSTASSTISSSESSSSPILSSSSSSSSSVFASSSIDSPSTAWTSSSISSSSGGGSISSSSSSGNNGTDPIPDDDDKSALSRSILIVIIVAGSVLLAVVIVLAVWCFRKRRLSNQSNYNHINSRNDVEMNGSLLKSTAYF